MDAKRNMRCAGQAGGGADGRKARQANYQDAWQEAWQAAWQAAWPVAWVVEPHGVALVHLANGRCRDLSYPEAAVWDLAVQGRSRETICSMLELIAGIGPREAATLVDSCLAQWLAAGWLEERRLEERRLEKGSSEAGAPE